MNFSAIIVRFGTISAPTRGMARWSARVLSAHWLLSAVTPASGVADNIFDSLAAGLRDAAICASKTPILLPILGLLLAHRLILGSLWTAVGQEFMSEEERQALRFRGGLIPYRQAILEVWHSPAFRPKRRRLVWSAFLGSALSGLASTSFAAWILTSRIVSPFITWILILLASIIITRLERLLTIRSYDRHKPQKVPPSPEEALERLESYIMRRPGFAATGIPLMFAYSSLDEESFGQRLVDLGNNSPMIVFFSRLLVPVNVVVLYSLFPIPSVESLKGRGFIGCLFGDLHGVAGFVQNHLWPEGALMVAIALAILPIVYLSLPIPFMSEWRFPVQVRVEVLRREARGIFWKLLTLVPVPAIASVGISLVLWASAAIALRFDSPLAGIVSLFMGSSLLKLLSSAVNRVVRGLYG
jgi:hypothetical protein